MCRNSTRDVRVVSRSQWTPVSSSITRRSPARWTRRRPRAGWSGRGVNRGPTVTCVFVASAGREELVERHAELADDRVERSHGRLDLSGLDLGDEARRDVEAPRQLAQAQPAVGALLAKALAETDCLFAISATSVRRIRHAPANSGTRRGLRETAQRARPARVASSGRLDRRRHRLQLVCPGRRSASRRCRGGEDERVALLQRSSSPSGRYLPGSLREWPTKRYVRASTNSGPLPSRTRSVTSPAARGPPTRPSRRPASSAGPSRPRAAGSRPP